MQSNKNFLHIYRYYVRVYGELNDYSYVQQGMVIDKQNNNTTDCEGEEDSKSIANNHTLNVNCRTLSLNKCAQYSRGEN